MLGMLNAHRGWYQVELEIVGFIQLSDRDLIEKVAMGLI